MTTLHSNNLQLQQINTSTRNGISASAGMLVYNTESGLQMYDGTNWQTVQANFSATGGTEDDSSRSGYKSHTFTSPGTFAMSGTTDVEYLIIGGGGGGGTDRGGGGGAGLLRFGTYPNLGPGNYPISVGGGGSRGNNSQGSTGSVGGSSSALGY